MEKNNKIFRAPIVVVLGHVDHGKTTLLDTIRKTHVAEKEAGNITQKIGAYQIFFDFKGKSWPITFIDTPGHEAFGKMRLRGVKTADIGILVVAGNEGVKPQTLEALSHLRSSKTPFILAITKADLPNLKIEKIKSDLAGKGVTFEKEGGETPVVKVSSVQNIGLKELLEYILVLTEYHGLKTYHPGTSFEGFVIEAKLDVKKGAVASIIVTSGKVRVGETIFSNEISAKVKAITSDRGQNLPEAFEGMPIEILGFEKLPTVGSQISAKPQDGPKENANLVKEIKSEMPEELRLILRADTQGSLEAINSNLPKGVQVIFSSTGNITVSDVLLAKNSRGLVLGFNVKVYGDVARLAAEEKVIIKTYTIIYQLFEELAQSLELLKSSQNQEEILGRAQIIAQFPYEKFKICGVKVLEGRLARGDKARILRGETIIGETRIKSLRVLKEDINKRNIGEECGVLLMPQVDFGLSDMLLCIS